MIVKTSVPVPFCRILNPKKIKKEKLLTEKRKQKRSQRRSGNGEPFLATAVAISSWEEDG